MSRRVRLTLQERAALACPDCASEVTATRRGRALHVDIRHDDSCPWHRRVSAGKPFTIAAILDQARRADR
ncbi:MAG TPA: hypothetical protein VGJ54_12260 [Streptosporangiaceae bacterium]|jgi:hypothetical protein